MVSQVKLGAEPLTIQKKSESAFNPGKEASQWTIETKQTDELLRHSELHVE